MTDDSEEIFDCMARMKGEERPFAVATVVRVEGAAAARAGAKAVIRGDGEIIGWIGGGCTTGAVRKAGLDSLVNGRARLIRVRPAGDDPPAGDDVESFKSVCPSGGTVEVFIEPVLPRPALLIAGASPVARVLCDLASRIGYAVTVAALPGDLAAFGSAVERIEGFDLGAAPRVDSGFLVVATQGRRDREALQAALQSGAPWVAFVGSRKKAAALKKAMAEAGVAKVRLDALRSPAGMHIGAVTPEEIALSILTDIVRERRMGAVTGDSDTREDRSAASKPEKPAGECHGH